MSRLDDILRSKYEEVDRLRKERPRDELELEAKNAPAVRGFGAALRNSHPTIIAEIKRSSPSKGIIAENLDVPSVSREYASGGASALSVLTDAPFFGGGAADLRSASASCSLPILRKDFILDELQVLESRGMGADAILLIVRILNDIQLHALYALAVQWGMDVLVETHNAEEVARANALGAAIIGVNNRDLDTFTVDLGTTERLRPLVRKGALVIAESGIHTADDALRMFQAGADAILVGEGIVRSPDRAEAIRTLRNTQYARSVR